MADYDDVPTSGYDESGRFLCDGTGGGDRPCEFGYLLTYLRRYGDGTSGGRCLLCPRGVGWVGATSVLTYLLAYPDMAMVLPVAGACCVPVGWDGLVLLRYLLTYLPRYGDGTSGGRCLLCPRRVGWVGATSILTYLLTYLLAYPDMVMVLPVAGARCVRGGGVDGASSGTATGLQLATGRLCRRRLVLMAWTSSPAARRGRTRVYTHTGQSLRVTA